MKKRSKKVVKPTPDDEVIQINTSSVDPDKDEPIALYFFDGYCPAEAIRMLLHHADIKYDDIRLPHDKKDFEILKKLPERIFEFGTVPVLQIGHKYYAQSVAILNLLGRKYNLYPWEWENDNERDDAIE